MHKVTEGRGYVTKAEVLITRRCNLQCGTCAVIDPARDETGKPVLGLDVELSVEEWKTAFDTIYNKLGASFIAIYGGEPLSLGDDKLVPLIAHLSKLTKGFSSRGFTVISNGIGLTRKRAKRFVDAGLDSWTSSVDAVDFSDLGDKFMAAKTHAGLRALSLMRDEFGIRDTCGIVTVTARNLDYVIPTVEALSAAGHWVGIDLVHTQRGDGEYTFSSSKAKIDAMGLTLTEEHLPQLAAIADHLIARHKDLMVFPTIQVLEMWKDKKFSIDLAWKCSPGHSITVDSDGSIGLCDDRMPNGYGRDRQNLAKIASGNSSNWNILDFSLGVHGVYRLWQRFLHWYEKDLDHCAGCAWSTHKMAVDALDDEGLREHYVHKRTPKDL